MFNKVQTVGSVNEFVTGEYKVKKELKKINKKLAVHGFKIGLATVAGLTLLDVSVPVAMADTVQAVPTFAGEQEIKESILNAFNPIIEMIKQLSYPIAGIMITAGSLLYMIGQQAKGIDMIQKAAIGYLLVQLSPLLLKLLVGIGSGIA